MVEQSAIRRCDRDSNIQERRSGQRALRRYNEGWRELLWDFQTDVPF
jgi:hypothetical protein